MAMKDEACDEDCLDDPIRLIDVEHQRVHPCPPRFTSGEKQATVSIDLTDSDVDVVSVEKAEIPSSVSVKSRNVRLLNKCKPLSIKVVDCDKHPWFYKKYFKHLHSETDDCIEISDGETIGEMEQHITLAVIDKSNTLDLSDGSKNEETDIMIPQVSLSRLLLSPNSGKPKIRPVDISSYYSSLGKDTKRKADTEKSNIKNNAKTDIFESQTKQKTEFDQNQKTVKKPDICKAQRQGAYVCSEPLPTKPNEVTKIDLKKNTGLVGLRIRYMEKLHFHKNIEEEIKLRSKEKKKSKKHKEKKQYSSVPVILIEGDKTKESLKISLNKEPYLKKKSYKNPHETNNNLEDKKPVNNDFLDQKPIIENDCTDLTKKIEPSENKDQVTANTLNSIVDSSKRFQGEVKELKDNETATLISGWETNHLHEKKQKPVLAEKVKNKLEKLFECKPKSKEKINQLDIMKSKGKPAKEKEKIAKKIKEVLNCKTTPAKDLNSPNNNDINKSLPTQEPGTLIFRDNDHNEIFKINTNVENKKSPFIQTPVSYNNDVAIKRILSSNSNLSVNKSLISINSTTSSDNAPINNSRTLKIARHLMPPQIARPVKETINKKQNIPHIRKENSLTSKKSDQEKIDPSILNLAKNLGIDIKRPGKKKAASVPKNKSSKSKDIRKTLPDMPNLDKFEKHALERTEFKSDVFTHQNKVEKPTVIVQNNNINSQNISTIQHQLNLNSEDKNINVGPYEINKNNFMTLQPQSANSEAVSHSSSIKNVTDNATPAKTNESVIKRNLAISQIASNYQPNVLRSDGAACHQILLKSNPQSTLGKFVAEMPANPNNNAKQSENNSVNYCKMNPMSMTQFQNMPPIDKLALSVNKLEQPINRPDRVRPTLPEGSRYNPPQFAPHQPAFPERSTTNSNLHYPPNMRCVPVNGNYQPIFTVRPNAIPYDNRYYPHQGNFDIQQNYRYQFRPPPPPPPPPQSHYMYRPVSNVNIAPKSHEGSKVIGQNIDGVIRTINLTAPQLESPEVPIKSKQEMLQELTKEMQTVNDVPAAMREVGGEEIPKQLHIGSKRPSADFSKPGPPAKKPNEFVKPKPPCTRTQAQPYATIHPQKDNIQTTPIVGYSPPILPIPTYQKTFEMLSQAALHCTASLITQTVAESQAGKSKIRHNETTEDSGQKVTESQTVLPAPQAAIDNNNFDKTGAGNLQTMAADKRRISIDEYKKRGVGPGENDVNKDNITVKIENPEIKNEPVETDCARRQSSDLDLGYDSDSTVKL